MPDPENSIAALSGPMREEARSALASRVERAVMQRRAMQERSIRAIELTHDAVRGLLESNADYRAGMARLWKETAEEVRRADAKERVTAPAGDRHLAALEDRAVLHTMGGGGSFSGASPQNHLDVFGPPYADNWSHAELKGAPHARRNVWANAGTGEIGFDYRIFPEAGSIYCGAAVWVNFMRRAPGSPPGQGAPGAVQVRAYTPYEYRWHDQSGMEAAHSDAGFGVYVLSWNLSGGDRVVEQDYSYPAWNNTTDWNWNQGNSSFPDTDSDYALYPPQMAPYFPIRPGRFYSAAIWCFGSGSAAGQLTDSRASLTESRLAANVRFVVVDQL
jgi:hypothetical protein